MSCGFGMIESRCCLRLWHGGLRSNSLAWNKGDRQGCMDGLRRLKTILLELLDRVRTRKLSILRAHHPGSREERIDVFCRRTRSLRRCWCHLHKILRMGYHTTLGEDHFNIYKQGADEY